MAIRKLPLNDFAFDNAVNDEAAAYWAGFLAADGWVCHRKGHSPEIGLGLSERDADHLREFCIFVGRPQAKFNHKVAKSGFGANCGSRQCSVQFSSRHMAETLATFGIVPRKSLIARFSVLTDNRHFWRGVICGDGTVSHKRISGHIYPYLGLTGSYDSLKQFTAFCSKHGVEKWTKFWQRPASRAWYTSITGAKCVQVVQLLFNDATVGLARKMRNAKKISTWKGGLWIDRSHWSAEFLAAEHHRLESWTAVARFLKVDPWIIYNRRKRLGLVK